MSNAVNFVNAYATAIQQLIQDLNTLENMNLQITSDSTLVTRYFAMASKTSPNGTVTPRTDIVAADVTAAQNAIVQMLFTFNSGNPSQAAALYKLTP